MRVVERRRAQNGTLKVNGRPGATNGGIDDGAAFVWAVRKEGETKSEVCS